MTPGAVACVLYARARACDPTFALESEENEGCYIVTASWRAHAPDPNRTYSSILALDVPDVVKLLKHALAALGRRGGRS